MKIGVDIRVLMDKHYSGISEYTCNLLREIKKQDTGNHYGLFYNSFHNLNKRLKEWRGVNSDLVSTSYPNKLFNYLLQKIFHYPKIDKILGGVDVFWSPHFNFTTIGNQTKKIITVHDLSFLRYPHFFSVRKNFWHKSLGVKKIIREADMVIAVSENTKNDIIELVGVPEDRVRVIYSGNNAHQEVIDEAKKEEFLNKQGIKRPFILYLGNIEPRKNISGLIEAYNILRADGLKIDLVLAGASGWKNKKIKHDWKHSPYNKDIKFLGYINKEEKGILYAAATVFVYPPFYEGFGFPPLEAMTYGLPVVCANTSSLSEVVGPAAIMVNPFKAKELSEAIQMVLSQESLRQKLITAGYERIRLFTWQETAKKYLELFKEIYHDKEEK